MCLNGLELTTLRASVSRYETAERSTILDLSDLRKRDGFDFIDLDGAVSNACDAKAIQSTRSFAGEPRPFVCGVEHTEVASALEQRTRRGSACHLRKAGFIGDEVHLTLFVRTRDAQRAEPCIRAKQHATDEHPLTRRRTLAHECGRLPRRSHGLRRNSDDPRERGVANWCSGVGKLGPRRSSIVDRPSSIEEHREPGPDKQAPMHLTAMSAWTPAAPPRSACASGVSPLEIGCGPSLSSRRHRTQSAHRCLDNSRRSSCCPSRP